MRSRFDEQLSLLNKKMTHMGTLCEELIARADGEYAVDLLMIAKYFERLGDHAVNIAEWVRYSITGKHERLDEETLLKLKHQLCN